MEQLDRAWSVVSHLNAVINSPELRDAYNANLRKVTELHAQMSQDSRMHGRYRALRARATIAWMAGDLAKEERVMEEAIYLARQAGRKDFESEAADELASVYLARLELDRAQHELRSVLAIKLVGAEHVLPGTGARGVGYAGRKVGAVLGGPQ